MDGFWTIFLVYLRLGLTSFGGPVAHLGYFRAEFVDRRKWVTEPAYADLVALCQFLPGPASSQVGAALGLARGGLPGAFAAWAGFTLPSAAALVLFGYGVAHFGNVLASGWMHGLKIVAVAIVAQALWAMGRSLCPDRRRATIAVAAACVLTAVPSTLGQIGVIVAGGVLGVALLREAATLPHASVGLGLRKTWGFAAIALFFLLLFALPLIPAAGNGALSLFNRFYQTGALVFGGGHVVLPLLQAQVVPTGLVSNDLFLAGYGAAQAVPGPLFTLAAYLGTVAATPVAGVLGATIALVAIFLPGFLLIIGVTPFWEGLRRYRAMQAAMKGINAAVVGILLAAFFNPVWSSAIRGPGDFAVAVAAVLALVFWGLSPWIVVVATAAAGAALAAF